MVVAIFSLFLFFFWLGYSQQRKAYNVKTGELIKGNSIFFLPWFLLTQKKQSMLQYNMKLHKNQPMVSTFILYKMLIRVRDPLLAKQVLNDTETFLHNSISLVKYADIFIGDEHLVAVNHDQWKRQSRILDPAFKALPNYYKIFADKTAIVLDKLIEKDGPVIESVHKYTQAMALDILGLSIFGYDFDSLLNDDNKNLQSYNYLMGLFFDTLKSIKAIFTHQLGFLSSTQETLRQLSVWSNLRKDLISDSKKKIQDKSISPSSYSMLDMMVESYLENEEEEKLSEKEIIDNIGIFFLAGHETTANALAFGIHCLAKYPEIQSKLRNEIKENIKSVNVETIEKLPYLTCFIKEVLRMYPPIAAIPAKITSKDVTLGDYFISKGSLVSISVLDIHYNQEYYDNPTQFIPERWDRDAKKKIPHHAWIPFSSGSRICIGNNFSMMEQKIFFTELLMKYELEMFDKNCEIQISEGSGLFQTPKDEKIKFQRLK
jgi:cytochrome P450